MDNSFSIEKPQFFKGKSYCLDFPTSIGSLKKSKYLLFIKEHGGKVDFSITSKTSYYITSIENITTPSTRTKTALKSKVPILLDTFIYECFNNNQCIDIYDYLYIDGKPASESIPNFFNIEETIEQSIKQSFSILNQLKSTLNCYNISTNTTSTTTTGINNSINYFDELEPESLTIKDDDVNEKVSSSFRFSKFSNNNNNNVEQSLTTQNNDNDNSEDDTKSNYSSYSSYSSYSTYSKYSIKKDGTNKPLSRFEQILLEKKELAQKRKEELKKIEEEKKKVKQDLLDQKKKEKEEKLLQLQKEKEEKLSQEKERRKQVLENTKSTLFTFNSKPTTLANKLNTTVTNTTTTTITTNGLGGSVLPSASYSYKPSTTSSSTLLSTRFGSSSLNNNNKKKSSSSLPSSSKTFGIKLDHEAIKIQKEKEKEEKRLKIENELLIKKQQKEERTRIYNENKQIEQDRLEKEKAEKQKQSLEEFLKRQEKRLKKQQEELERKEKEEKEENGELKPPPPQVELPNEDLRKLFVGGINCDDLDERTKKDLKKCEKIKLKRLNFLLHQFDQFGEIQKRTVLLDKGIFFITYKSIESCQSAINSFSVMENKLKLIDLIKAHPNALKLPQTVPNKHFYVRQVKNFENAKKKEEKNLISKEDIKSKAKSELIKKKEKEDNEGFEDWITV